MTDDIFNMQMRKNLWQGKRRWLVLAAVGAAAALVLLGWWYKTNQAGKLFLAYFEEKEIRFGLVDGKTGKTLAQAAVPRRPEIYPLLGKHSGLASTSPAIYDPKTGLVLMVNNDWVDSVVYTTPINGGKELEKKFVIKDMRVSKAALNIKRHSLMYLSVGSFGGGELRELSLDDWKERKIFEFTGFDGNVVGTVTDLVISGNGNEVYWIEEARGGRGSETNEEEIWYNRADLAGNSIKTFMITRGNDWLFSDRGISRNGNPVAVLRGRGSLIMQAKLFDIQKNTQIDLGKPAMMGDLNAWLSRNSRQIAVPERDGIKIYDLKGNLLKKLGVDYIYEWSGDGNRMMVISGGKNKILDLRTGREAEIEFSPGMYRYLAVQWL